MNRRSFFANLFGAAALAVAQRVCPAALHTHRLRNFVLLPHGEVTVRPGMAKMAALKTEAKYVTFAVDLAAPVLDGATIWFRKGERYYVIEER